MENTAAELRMKRTSKPARRTAWAILLLLFVGVLAIVLIPAWIVQPFKAQSQGGLALSYALRRWSPLLTLAALAIVLMLIVRLWRGTRWWRKAIMVVVLLLASVSTWFARQNYFEWMFNPLPNAAYARASEASFVADTDMVMAVERNGEAVAYPVRLMAYHHVVQDVLGGTPVVATY